jgi:hypothetical protein
MRAEAEKSAVVLARKEKVAKAGGKLVGAAFAFIGEMFQDQESSEGMDALIEFFKAKLGDCMEKTEDGRLNMTITLPDETFLENMAKSLAGIVSLGMD